MFRLFAADSLLHDGLVIHADTTEELSKALEDVLTLRSELTALESRQCEGSESSQAALVHTRCLLQEAQAEVTRLREGKAVEPTAPSEQERQLSALVQRLQVRLGVERCGCHQLRDCRLPQIELKDACKMYAKQVEDLRKMLAKSEELAALRQAKIDELLGSMRSAATDVKTATELSSQQEDTIYRLRNELVHNQMAKDVR